MRRTPFAALAAVVALVAPAGAGTPLWAETYPTMPGTQNSIDSEASGTVVAVVGGTTVVASRDAGLTWVPLGPLASPPNGGSSHTRVSPATKTTWFAENGRAVSATTDGGTTWRRLALPPVVRDPRQSFEYATEVAAADGAPTAAVGWDGARIVDGCPHLFRFTPIYVTHDGGARWRRADLPVSGGRVESIAWFDRKRATAVLWEFDWPEPTREGNECGMNASVARSSVWTTTDGGASWRRAYRSDGPALLAASWSTPTTISVVEEIVGVGRTFVSNDGGRTFGRKAPLYDVTVNGFPSMQFTGGRRGWIGAIVGGVFRSDTAGAEWTHEVSPADGAIYGVPELTAVSRDHAVYAGPRSIVSRVGEAPVARFAAPPGAYVASPALVTTRLGGVSSVLTLPVRGLPEMEWRVAAGA